jgi:hypothetical protein
LKQSGRLQLAQWLTSPHPLTARVMVNRVWLQLFGEGLVSTPDDFGLSGERPTHPELLDHLATRFMREGWSIKRLIRSIVLSRTYQLSSLCMQNSARLIPTICCTLVTTAAVSTLNPCAMLCSPPRGI